ncbi:glycosyltransferase family 2 protein [Lentibacter sp. XHP0401]|uniref:glycosyltransferase family 2 protein n=1 Tax=Lentibacter sp. XHP0401 TaxID=2984334 RepID=UPI0021E9989A|nr:glycosyltransferase family 2 protein [Lentibacter sp. XHP0401]MCV2893923.1 glycosyltransferase family 2 protein [Lentibacter sp. XHP0401]
MNWGVVSTAKASPEEIARFAAHHISIGCARIDIYLDGPTERLELLAHRNLHFHQGTSAQKPLNQRQMDNATHAYQQADTDWLAHIDLDEFILPETDLTEQLITLPDSTEWVRLLPAEALASEPLTHYKRAPQHAGLKRGVLEALYPDYGLALRTGFISHTEGKAIARTGLAGARMGIHKLRGRKKPKPAALMAHLLHHHATTWENFSAHMHRRMTGTSYTSAREGEASIADIIEMITAERGADGVKHFYHSLRSASPEHLATLEKLGLLVTHDLQLNAKARKLFPKLEGLYT